MAEEPISALSPASSHGASAPKAASTDEIRESLAHILSSLEFRSSNRSKEFLKYVVESTVAGHGDTLKERTIGIDVYGRPASYDPADDATVRVKAGEVRKRLDRYYATEGKIDRLRIELPPGTYTPVFRRVEIADPVSAPLAVTPAANPPSRRYRVVWITAGIVMALASGIAFWLTKTAPKTAVDRFWGPVINGSTPVLLTAAYVPVYNLNQPPGSHEPPKPQQFVLLNDQFVGGGDLVATARIVAMLTRTGHPWQVKVGSDVSFADLRNSPTVLIGYSYTRWKEVSREMRYFIDADRWPRMVTDNGKPTQWALPDLPADRRTDEDYAIVSRVFHPETRAMLVEISGITQYGTSAGAELVTNPDVLAEALKNAPKEWERKNLQFVVHVRVIAGTPASPRVVASYFW
ncbi:MAG TPA: hypothetical protein VML19_19385 [Verrucomicrobiae bacterium]|nr:hypothetical protein [Verrucomicrobiae bacterium]